MKTAEIASIFQCELMNSLEHLKFKFYNGMHVVTLIDIKGYEIIKGYGSTQAAALNDLHSNLI